mgnify:CR=1 FL=1
MSNTLYINGKWTSPVEGHTWDVISPADGRVVATVAEGTGADVELAITAARTAFDKGEFPYWGFEKRAALVGKIADLMELRGELGAQLGGAPQSYRQICQQSDQVLLDHCY